jgi:hypothetical protein
MVRFPSAGALTPGSSSTTGITARARVFHPAYNLGGPFMDGGITRRLTGSRWRLTLMVGLGVLVTVIVLWRYQIDYQARQQANAAEREARLGVLRAQEEARRMEAERQAAKVRSIARVSELYREIDNLSQLSDRVETSLRGRLRVLKDTVPKSQVTP